MKKGEYKSKMSIFFISIHFLTIAAAYLYYILSWYSLEFFQSALVIIVPLFATTSTLLVNQIFVDNFSDPALVPKATIVISFFIPSVFSLALFGILTKQALKPTLSLDQFTLLLGGLETAFGIYLATIVRRMFNIQDDETQDK